MRVYTAELTLLCSNQHVALKEEIIPVKTVFGLYIDHSCTSRVKKKAIHTYNNEVHRHSSAKKIPRMIKPMIYRAFFIELKFYDKDDNKKNQNLSLICTSL